MSVLRRCLFLAGFLFRRVIGKQETPYFTGFVIGNAEHILAAQRIKVTTGEVKSFCLRAHVVIFGTGFTVDLH